MAALDRTPGWLSREKIAKGQDGPSDITTAQSISGNSSDPCKDPAFDVSAAPAGSDEQSAGSTWERALAVLHPRPHQLPQTRTHSQHQRDHGMITA